MGKERATGGGDVLYLAYSASSNKKISEKTCNSVQGFDGSGEMSVEKLNAGAFNTLHHLREIKTLSQQQYIEESSKDEIWVAAHTIQTFIEELMDKVQVMSDIRPKEAG